MPLIVALLSILTFFLPCVSADDKIPSDQIRWEREIKKQGFVFSLENVELKSTPSGAPQDTSKTSVADQPELSRSKLIVRFKVRNDTQTQKIDLGKNFIFSLKDEFNNSYRFLEEPDGVPGISQDHPRNYPSFYPGDSYAQTIFFEAPVDKSQLLLFVVDGFELGIKDPVVFQIPRPSILGMENAPRVPRSAQSDPGGKPGAPLKVPPEALKIVAPGTHIVVKPGETIHLEVKIQDGIILPDNIFVISPGFVLEDPKVVLGYDFLVPKDYAQGMLTLIVIGKWLQDGQAVLSSDSITVTVVDPVKKCFKDCVDQNKDIEMCVNECREADKV